MQVILAGYNLDIETIKEYRTLLEKAAQDKRTAPKLKKDIENLLQLDNLTPETLSAAYARISRNPAPIPELRQISRKEVDKARKSNQNIIFGLGHSSVAEHAVFNLDVMGVSRFAVEEIEKFRLCSFTEKSQRYILLQDDYVIPEELRDESLREKFRSTLQLQNETYHWLYDRIRPYFFEKYRDLAGDKKNHRRLEGLAKEDARYVIAQATETQLGMTANSRNIEHIIKRCASHPLREVNEFARQLYDRLHGLVPSLVKYTEPTAYELHTGKGLGETVQKIIGPRGNREINEVNLVSFTPGGDAAILETLFYTVTGESPEVIRKKVQGLSPEQRNRVFLETFRHIAVHDSVLREFETVDLVFELVISCSCFAQLKRHRLASVFARPYDPELGVTIPDSIRETGSVERFMEVISRTEKTYGDIQEYNPLIAPYILSNAHRRRVLFKINARALYHFSRLREDEHAQWDIRRIGHQMMELAREKMPLTFQLACGKNRFEKIKNDIFQR